MQWKFMSTMDLSYKNVTVSNVCLCNKTHSQPFDFVEIGFRISICPMNQMPFLVNFFWPNTPSLEIEKANINWAKFLSKIHFALLEVYPMIVCLATVTPAYNLSKYSWVVVVGNSMNCVHFCNNTSKPTVQRICGPGCDPCTLCIGQCAQLPMHKVYCYRMYPVVTRAQEELPRENQSRQHPAGYLSLGWAIFYHLYFSVKCSCLNAGHLSPIPFPG